MYRHCEPTGRANARTPLARRPGQAKREPGSIRRALSFWARRRRPSVPTNAGGYGSLLSQGRRKRIQMSDSRRSIATPRRDASELCMNFFRPEERAQGNAGCPLHPQSVCKGRKHTVVTTGTPEHPAFPAQWFYGLFRALPGDRAFLPPSSADCSANLTPASGRQDHTASPSATSVFVQRAFARPTPLRPSHPTPNVRDDRDTPLSRGGTREF